MLCYMRKFKQNLSIVCGINACNIWLEDTSKSGGIFGQTTTKIIVKDINNKTVFENSSKTDNKYGHIYSDKIVCLSAKFHIRSRDFKKLTCKITKPFKIIRTDLN